MELQNVKGTYDYLPNKQEIREYVKDTLKSVFAKYGYKALETPILCYYDLLASKYSGGAEILKEVYKLSDQGNRELGLRYDLTVPFAKVVAMNVNKNITLPFKRYEIGRVFRDGPVKVGRNREFIQCDVDVIGIKSMMIDAEFIALYVEGFKKLNLDVVVQYNNRKLLSGLILESGISEEKMIETITIVDKFKKLTKEELQAEFENLEIEKKQYSKLIEYLDYDFDQIKEKFKESSNTYLQEGIKELDELNEYIDYMDLNYYVELSLSLARGHDIYTGTVYEVYLKDKTITSSIGGGGRYDKIITNFVNDGNEYPAIGISFGLDVICEALNRKNNDSIYNQSQVYIIPLDTKKESLGFAEKLRQKGIKVDLSMTDIKLKKALNYANKENIPYVIILGVDEINNNQIKIKDMINSKEQVFAMDQIDDIVNYIK